MHVFCVIVIMILHILFIVRTCVAILFCFSCYAILNKHLTFVYSVIATMMDTAPSVLKDLQPSSPANSMDKP